MRMRYALALALVNSVAAILSGAATEADDVGGSRGRA